MKGKKAVNNSDPLQIWERAEKKFRKMSPKEQAQTLVTAGIVTEKMNLRKPYRGVFITKKAANG